MEFLKYKIQNGDTLNSISLRLGITEEELKLFHNTHCEKMDVIWFSNLNYVDFLLIPLHFKTENQKESDRKNELPYLELFDSFYSKKYAAQETIEDPFKKFFFINYIVKLGIDKFNEYQIVNFDRQDFKTNGESPDDKMSDLSLACMRNISPISIILTPTGKIAGFHDYDQILKRFKDLRFDLEEFYTGEASKIYIDSFEKSICDEKYFFKQLQSTFLFQTLFPKMDWFHRKNSWIENFYLFQNSFSVPFVLKTETDHNHPDFVETMIKGNLQESYSLQELKRGVRDPDRDSQEALNAEICIKYKTDKINKNLLEAESTMVISHEGILYQKHNLILTQIV